jgi:glycosyltransferase involved in cell wall biosynthesis
VRICRENGVTILNPHHPVAAMYGVKAARSLGIPMVVYMHDAQRPKKTYALATRYVAAAGAHFVAVSHAVRRRLEGIGVSPASIQVLYYGIDRSFLDERPEPRAEVSGPGPNIGVFAQVMPWKGQDLFLEAAARLSDRLPTAHFYVVGGLAYDDDQPFLDKLKGMSDTPKLKGRVTFTGFQKDVARWMVSMDVVVLSSTDDEALPMVPVEAMALGKRVVCTAVGGTVEIVEDNVTGRLVARDDPDALASGIEDMVLRPADDSIGERASAAIHERFTPERFGNDLMEVYAKANERRKEGRA